jgi:uncharacterized C2H2 Zn-finger protein
MLAEELRCPLCGATFDAQAAGCRPSCPLARGCSALCCPRCHYSFPREAGLAALLRKALLRLHPRRSP